MLTIISVRLAAIRLPPEICLSVCIADFLAHLRDVASSTPPNRILSFSIFRDKCGVPHEFIIIALELVNSARCFIRLDRRPAKSWTLRMSSPLDAMDLVRHLHR